MKSKIMHKDAKIIWKIYTKLEKDMMHSAYCTKICCIYSEKCSKREKSKLRLACRAKMSDNRKGDNGQTVTWNVCIRETQYFNLCRMEIDGKKEKEIIMGVKVLLDSVDKVRDFIDITRSAPYDIDLISGRNTYLDAKSLLGVLSCDCRKPLVLDIHAEMEERAELMSKLEKYVVA